MPKPLRWFSADKTYFITQRCSEERNFLEPSRAVNHCIGAWIARGQERYRVDIIAYCIMSNHWHFVLRAPKNNISRFMAYIAGNVARGLNRIHGHRGDVWESRYSAQPILDDEALQERIEYTEMNPVRAKACRQPDEWCGLTSARHAEHEIRFDMVHARDWQRRSSRALSRLAHHTKTHCLRISRIRPGVRCKVRGFLRRDPFSRPKRPKRTKAPLCFGCVASWRTYRDFYRTFRRAFAIASEKFLRGMWKTPFPPGSFRPPIHFIVPDMPAT